MTGVREIIYDFLRCASEYDSIDLDMQGKKLWASNHCAVTDTTDIGFRYLLHARSIKRR
jgi:hypothetical protein